MRAARRLLRLLAREEGISLIMAVGILGVLSVSGTTLIYAASSNGRTAEYSKDNNTAYSLAEAGINEMMAVLANSSNNALNEYLLGRRADGTLQATVRVYDGGTVEWWGTLDRANARWSLTSIGRVTNPTGPGTSDVTRKLTASARVTSTTTQPLNNPSWNYIMSTQVTGNQCDMTVRQGVEVKTNLYVFGNLCLEQTGKILRGENNSTILAVKGKVTQFTQQNTIGTASQPIDEVTVGNGCVWWNKPFYNPCVKEPGADTEIFATSFSTSPAELVRPSAYFDAWYLNAAPGPYYPCTSVSGTPPTWDNPVAAAGSDDGTRLSYRDNNLATQNLIPSTPYSCRVAGGGELTWDYAAKTLTVSGTVYIDGDFKLEPPTGGVWTVRYHGQATIYASGSILMKNVKVCGAVSGSNCDFAAWDPNSDLLVLVAEGTNRQTDVPAEVSIEVKNTHFQGALFAAHKIQLDTTSKVDGPMIGTEVVLGQSTGTSDFPTITTVPAGMPGNPTVYAQPNAPEFYSG